MDRKKTNIIPFSTNNGSSYNAETEKNENVIGERIAQALNDNGFSKKAFCEVLKAYGVDVSHSALGKWTNGQTVPNAYQLLAICHALDISEGLPYFTGTFTPLLNKAGQDKVRAYRDDLIATGKYKPQSKVTNLIRYIDMPVSNLCVSAGTGAFLDEGNFEMVSFPENEVPEGADFGVRVSGNSMEPVYHDGQIVWVHQCETIDVGQVGIFIYDGEGFLKRYGEQEPDEGALEAFTDSYGTVRMQPVMISYNKDYPDRVIRPESSFQVVGRVL
mgnify:FL=1